MFSINCKLLRQILRDMGSALEISPRSYQPVQFHVTPQATSLSMATAEVSVSCQIPQGGAEQHFGVALRTLSSLACPARGELEFHSPGGSRLELRWYSSGSQQTLPGERLAPEDRPPEPQWLISNPRQLGSTLQLAAALTAQDSSRYALNCLRLRGSDGQLAATDGRQAFTQAGFSFPVDEVLVPAAALRRLTCLSRCSSISVGRSSDWLSLRLAAGTLRWLVDLKIFHPGRFPRVEACLPAANSARATLTLDPHDARYLLGLKPLLGRAAHSSPLTLELDCDRLSGQQQVVLRFRPANCAGAMSPADSSTGDRRLTEVLLAASSFTGSPVRLAMEPRYLLSALQFGFPQWQLPADPAPLFCTDSRRWYVWMPSPSGCVLHSRPSAQRLSTACPAAVA